MPDGHTFKGEGGGGSVLLLQNIMRYCSYPSKLPVLVNRIFLQSLQLMFNW